MKGDGLSFLTPQFEIPVIKIFNRLVVFVSEFQWGVDALQHRVRSIAGKLYHWRHTEHVEQQQAGAGQAGPEKERASSGMARSFRFRRVHGGNLMKQNRKEKQFRERAMPRRSGRCRFGNRRSCE
jgi:hypothetical protein